MTEITETPLGKYLFNRTNEFVRKHANPAKDVKVSSMENQLIDFFKTNPNAFGCQTVNTKRLLETMLDLPKFTLGKDDNQNRYAESAYPKGVILKTKHKRPRYVISTGVNNHYYDAHPSAHWNKVRHIHPSDLDLVFVHKEDVQKLLEKGGEHLVNTLEIIVL